MAISVVCDCGQKLKVKDEMAGKKAKCPSCHTVVAVPAGDDDDEDAAPAKKGKAKGRGMGLWIGLGVGVLVLGFCCLGVGGVGAWFLFLRGPSLDSRVVGKWVPDVEPTKKGSPKNPQDLVAQVFGGDIQFKADGTVIDNTPMTPITQGKWKTVSSKGDMVTVELSQSIISKKLDIKIVDSDHLKITPDGSKTEFSFKRAP
jgi:hypothetical protein